MLEILTNESTLKLRENRIPCWPSGAYRMWFLLFPSLFYVVRIRLFGARADGTNQSCETKRCYNETSWSRDAVDSMTTIGSTNKWADVRRNYYITHVRHYVISDSVGLWLRNASRIVRYHSSSRGLQALLKTVLHVYMQSKYASFLVVPNFTSKCLKYNIYISETERSRVQNNQRYIELKL